MAPVKVNNFTKLYTLVMLNEGTQHGYELMKAISSKLDKKISPGEIYPFLAKLEEKGLVKSKEVGGREKKTYILTAEGKKFTKGLLAKFETVIHSLIEEKVVQCSHCDCEIYEGGYEKSVNGKKVVFCCEHCARASQGGHTHD